MKIKSDLVWLHLMVVLLSFTAILGKLIASDTIILILYRTLFTSSFLLLLYKLKKRKLSSRQIGQLLAVGGVLGVHWFCFFGSARLANVSISLIAVSTIATFTSLIEPLFGLRKFSKKDLFLGLLSAFGMALIFKFEFQYLDGILLGLLGSVLASFYTVINTRFVTKIDSLSINTFEILGAFLIALLAGIVLLSFDSSFTLDKLKLPHYDLYWILILAFVCTVIPYLKIVDLLKKFSAFTVNLTINMEPIYGILMAYLIFGESEKMSVGFYIGSLFIILSLLLNEWDFKKWNPIKNWIPEK